MFAPLVDIYENEKALLFIADMPGVGDDDIDVRLEKGELTMEGRRFARYHAESSKGFVYRRTFVMPKAILPENISAKFAEGILKIEVPKRDVVATRQIPVTTS